MLFIGGFLWAKPESGVCHWPPIPLPRTRDVASHSARKPRTYRARREHEPKREWQDFLCHSLCKFLFSPDFVL